MRIAVYTSGDFPYGLAPENFVRQMALGLHHAGSLTEVVRWRGSRYPFQNDTPVRAFHFLFRKPFSNELLKFAELLLLLCFIPLKLVYRKIFRGDQVIILYGLEYAYIVLPFLLCAKLTRTKCFRVITDAYAVQSIVPVGWKKPKLWFYRLQAAYADRLLDGLVVLSSHLRDACLARGIPAEKVLLIHHFIDAGGSSGAPSGQTANRIGYVGTPSEANGITDLAAAFRMVTEKIPAAELMIIGRMDQELQQRIREISGEKGKLFFPGMLPKEEAAAGMRSCSVLVNPRRKGNWADAGFPTKLGEYLASRIPVVQTRTGDPAHCLADHREVVFATPNDPASLAAAILYVLEDQARAETIGNAGYQWAVEHLDYLANGRKLLAFLEGRVRK